MSDQTVDWFEIGQLVVAVLTPVALFILGYRVDRASKRAEAAARRAAEELEQARWADRRAVERLIELHKEMAPLLNDLLCFFSTIGHFREIDPPGALHRKRRLDRIYFANEHLFQPRFRDAYRAFMNSCFAHWGPVGEDAKIRLSATRLRTERGLRMPWDADWDRLFEEAKDSHDRRTRPQAAYDSVMAAFADELGLQRFPPGNSWGRS